MRSLYPVLWAKIKNAHKALSLIRIEWYNSPLKKTYEIFLAKA